MEIFNCNNNTVMVNIRLKLYLMMAIKINHALFKNIIQM